MPEFVETAYTSTRLSTHLHTLTRRIAELGVEHLRELGFDSEKMYENADRIYSLLHDFCRNLSSRRHVMRNQFFREMDNPEFEEFATATFQFATIFDLALKQLEDHLPKYLKSVRIIEHCRLRSLFFRKVKHGWKHYQLMKQLTEVSFAPPSGNAPPVLRLGGFRYHEAQRQFSKRKHAQISIAGDLPKP